MVADAVFESALEFTLRWEGGYVNHPADPGGETNKGVIQRVYDSWRRRRGLHLQSVRFITDAEVRAIYHQDYWVPARCPEMIKPLAIVQFDTAVNFGVRGAIMFLQEALGAYPIDGIWGEITQGKFERGNSKDTALRICDGRIGYRYQRVKEAPSQRVFLQGWLNRDSDLKAYIRGM